MRFIFILALLSMHSVFAGDISVQIALNNNAITMDDQIELEVQVNGTQSASDPKIMGSENFSIQESGTSSQLQMINGATTVTKVFQFILVPKREGEFTLGPAIVDVDGTEYKSQTATIKVAKTQNQDRTQAPEGKNAFVEAVVDKTSPFVHEQFIYTFRLFTRAGMSNASLDFPEFKGLWKEQLGDQRKYEKMINGIPWQVLEISYLLTGLGPGKVTIEEARLLGDVIVEGSGRRRGHSMFDQIFGGGFAERRRVQLVAHAIPIEVRELPTPRPDGFSGLVGNFSLEAKIDKDTVKVGESVTMTVLLKGYGQLENAVLPVQETEDFKFYDDKPTLQKNLVPSGVLASKMFKRAIIPKKEGTQTFPAIKLVIFNPASKSYQTIQSESFALNVLPGEKDDINHTALQPTVSSKKSIEILGQDLMPIRYSLNSLNDGELGLSAKIILVIIILGLPILYFFLQLIISRRLVSKGDIRLTRKTKAAKEFLDDYKKLIQSSKFIEDAINLFKDYLGNKCNVDGRAITQFDVERLLVPRKINPSTIAEIKDFFDRIEKSQYGGVALSADGKKNILSKVKLLFEKIEKEMKS